MFQMGISKLYQVSFELMLKADCKTVGIEISSSVLEEELPVVEQHAYS